MSVLIVFTGLPGTGKTTLASRLARELGAVYLRLDVIEQAIREAGIATDVGTSGYRVANGLALGNLRLGHQVVVDCVNPVAESRQAWAQVAADAGARLCDVRVICSDAAEHRRRVETRQGDIPGLVLPTWASVQRHAFDPWDSPPFTVDTARLTVDAALEAIRTHLSLPA